MKSGDELDWIAVAQKMEDEEAAAAAAAAAPTSAVVQGGTANKRKRTDGIVQVNFQVC
jgi:hypothetical protein